jgi:hypothetical protein
MFVSPFLTGTGLPIERDSDDEGGGKVWIASADLKWRWEDGRWIADFDTSGRVPAGLPHGHYVLTAGALWNLAGQSLEPGANRPFAVTIRNNTAYQPVLAVVAVGDPAPPRLAATLLTDELTEGARGGAIAREEAGLFDISARAVTRHAPIMPRLDWHGDPWAYRLEPFLPMVDAVDRAISSPPVVEFDLGRGALTVTVIRPDGGIDRLGPAPLTRFTVKSPRVAWNDATGRGGGDLREIPQLQGDGDMFEYEFPTDGKYVVVLDGRVFDVSGREYRICGTYDLTVANVLDVEAALLPGTPFEVGAALPVAAHVAPAGPADLDFLVTHVGADGSVTRQSYQGRANDHGWWDGDGASFVFDRPGEYRVDITASYRDRDGRAWAGALTFGSVIATPNAPVIAHGRRGPDNQNRIAPPWAFETAFVMDPSDHMQFPYFTGDVLWGVTDSDAGDAVVTRTSIQAVDQSDPLVKRALALSKARPIYSGPTFEERLRAGEVPLVLAPEGRAPGLGAHPDDLNLWSYMYAAVERPGVRVRELVQGNDVSGVYWRFGDAYHGQSGNGPEGDRPGDFKFMYSGAVIRDVELGQGIYAIYASGWVHARDDDPLGARFMPPFQGAAGGPDGGPLLTVHGRDVDILFVPQGVRPGSVLAVGDRFRMAGPIMPTLPSKVDFTVVRPDGVEMSYSGRANAIGYFYDPANDFVVEQPGLWTVRMRVTHDGQTSAGTVTPPFPTGGPLTPDLTTFTFVVVDNRTIVLDVSSDLESNPPSTWFWSVRDAVYEAPLPPGWVGGSGRVVVTIPGVVLVDRPVPVTSGTMRWELRGAEMNALASNFDVETGLADTVSVTFYAEGSLNGVPARAAGSVVTNGATVPGAVSPGP